MTYDIVSKRITKKIFSIKNPDDIYKFLRRYTKNRQEQFFVLTLNGTHEVIAIHIVSIGLVNMTIVHPREVFIHAITDNAVSVVVAHNHPSGSPNPSDEDIEVTKRLKEAGGIIGINFIDHLIIGKKDYYSFKLNNII